MRIITKDLTQELDKTSNSAYLKGKNYLIFDIETTGFSRQYEIIYMVGCICKTDEDYKYYNVFAESPEEEPEVIKYFFNLLENIDYMIHFNGNRFDIPFLLARAAKHNIADKISHIESIDIYDLLRPFRKSLDFPNLKLDTIQAHLGYKRKDEYTGGDLIQIYHHYTQNPYEPYYELLALHNKEDVEGMINLLPIIDMTNLIDDIINKDKIAFTSVRKNNDFLTLVYELPKESLMDFNLTSTCRTQVSFKKGSNQTHLHLPISEDEKRFFFDNYKDYMYLIEKDEVMHKSVASFIPREQKRRAKKSECYVQHTGLFIPIFFSTIEENQNLRLFKDELRSKNQFVIANSDLDQTFHHTQIQGFLKVLKGIK